MVVRANKKTRAQRGPSARCDWLEMLDKRARRLKVKSQWLKDSVLAPQRCRLFLMARFPELPRPFPDAVFDRQLLRGESQLVDSKHAKRVLRGLSPVQTHQLGALVLDIQEALEDYGRYQRSSKTAQKIAAEAGGRTRMLARKVAGSKQKLEDLRDYAAGLHVFLGVEHTRVAKQCLKMLADLKEDPTAGAYYRSLKAEYSAIEGPRQLGIIELYWFFWHECKCSGRESEVRVAMIVNEFLTSPGRGKLKYRAKYRDAETQGSAAVRLAVSRHHPRTTNSISAWKF